MEILSFSAQKRTDINKSAKNSLRKEGRIPAVVYGGDVSEHISITFKDVKQLIYTPDFKLADIAIEGSNHKCLIKDVQFHPVTEDIMHIDFLKLIDGKPIKAAVPLRFKGASPGVKEGGKLIPLVRRIKIKTTPENLVDELFVDISGLNLGESVRVRDIEVSDDIEIMTTPASPVASVEVPRALRSAEDALEKEEGEATPEAAPEAAQEA